MAPDRKVPHSIKLTYSINKDLYADVLPLCLSLNSIFCKDYYLSLCQCFYYATEAILFIILHLWN